MVSSGIQTPSLPGSPTTSSRALRAYPTQDVTLSADTGPISTCTACEPTPLVLGVDRRPSASVDTLSLTTRIEGTVMPEAVVVAATRSPIGRANKGSLVDM